MDQFSDWLGSWFPIGYRRPPKHPLKVSLVMGLLGFVSGYATALSLLVIQAVFDQSTVPVNLIAGTMFSLIVVMPMIKWMNTGRSTIVWATIYSAIIPAAGICSLIHNMNGGTTGLLFMLIVILFGIVWGIGSLWLGGRFGSKWIISQMLIGLVTVFIMKETLIPYVNLKSISWNVTIFSTICSHDELYFLVRHIVAAVCLGILVWDRIPRPRFEMPESG